MKKLLPVLALIALLGGCAIRPAPVVIKPPLPGPVIVKPAGGGHCPPGQAKKGNC